jgi:AGCS family alanine or glycine:cation symporter
MTVGAAAAVATATAVSLGGAGILFWVWVFAFLLAPLRYAEVMLSRTDVPGRSEVEESGSLARRLMREEGSKRALGFVTIVLLAVTGFAFVGGVHGEALLDLGSSTLPTSVPIAGYAVAAVGALVVILGLRLGGALAAWLAVAALATLVVAAILGLSGNPGRAFGTLGRMFGEAFSGAPAATPWVGASWREILIAALIFAVPPLAASGGAVGSLHGAARAKATRKQAETALLGPLLYALVTTLLVMAFVGSGAFFRRVQTERPFRDIAVYEVGFETRSQRDEPERLHSGYLRIVDGEARDITLEFATERAMIDTPRFEFRGRPADVALHLEAGRPQRMLRPRDGTLTEVSLTEVNDLVISGEMIPRGGPMVVAAMERGSGGDLAARLAFIAVLLLLAVGTGAFGVALSRSLPRGAPKWSTIAIGLLPSAGVALAAAAVVPELAAIGGIAAALSATIAALAVAIGARQAT